MARQRELVRVVTIRVLRSLRDRKPGLCPARARGPREPQYPVLYVREGRAGRREPTCRLRCRTRSTPCGTRRNPPIREPRAPAAPAQGFSRGARSSVPDSDLAKQTALRGCLVETGPRAAFAPRRSIHEYQGETLRVTSMIPAMVSSSHSPTKSARQPGESGSQGLSTCQHVPCGIAVVGEHALVVGRAVVVDA